MINQFSIDYPSWTLAFPLLVGLIYASVLYLIPLKSGKKHKLSKSIRYSLFGLRFIAISLISLLLLNPFIKTSKKHIEKPKLIVAIDNSSSMLLSPDSANIKNKIESNINNLNERYSADYDVEKLLFGNRISFKTIDFSDAFSNYSQLFEYIKKQYPPKQVEAMVLIGDGIFNIGRNPSGQSQKPYKIISVGIGDTNTIADAGFNDISFNSINYLNENIPLEINFSANQMEGEKINLQIHKNTKLLINKTINVNSTNFNKTIKLDLKAEEVGKMHLKLSLKSERQEHNKLNNFADVFIDILDSKQNILILANSPHPDISALKQALENHKNYEVEIKFAGDKIDKLSKYNLLILHQLPSSNNRIPNLLKEAKKMNLATLAIVGRQTEFASLRKFYDKAGIKSAIRNYDKAKPLFNKTFSFFSLDNIDIQSLESLPPLNVPLANFSGLDNSTVLAWQELNDIKTNFPLIYFTSNTEMKSAIIMGTGLWNWRNNIYLEKGNFEDFDNLMGKIVQYLSLKTDKRRFKIHNKGEYFIPGNVELEAELYNESFEIIDDAEIDLDLINESGEHFDYIFTSDNKNYKLNISDLSAGTYKYTSSSNYKNESFSDKGEFIIKRNIIEHQNIKANFNLLYKLADNNNGIFTDINNFDAVYNFIDELKAKKRVSYSLNYKGLNDIPFLLALILILLCAEWFIRKYMGSY